PQPSITDEIPDPASSTIRERTSSQAVSTLSKKPQSEHFGTLVIIEVGPQKKAYSIHKDLLCFYSDYFHRAFNGSFKEAVEGKLSLPDADADLFYIVNGFLYTRQLRSQDNQTGPDLGFTTLGNLWGFGDRYLMPLLQNTAMDAYIKRAYTLKGTFSAQSIARRYRETFPGSPLRRFLVDWQAHKSEQSREKLGNWPQEAVVDLAIALFSMKPEHRGINKVPNDRGKCYYHVHAEGDHC
ncbi:unnamed protein product, partial [Aureobasidium mustum]